MGEHNTKKIAYLDVAIVGSAAVLSALNSWNRREKRTFGTCRLLVPPFAIRCAGPYYSMLVYAASTAPRPVCTRYGFPIYHGPSKHTGCRRRRCRCLSNASVPKTKQARMFVSDKKMEGRYDVQRMPESTNCRKLETTLRL